MVLHIKTMLQHSPGQMQGLLSSYILNQLKILKIASDSLFVILQVP